MTGDFVHRWIIFQLSLAALVTSFQPEILNVCCDIGKQWHENNGGACPLYPVSDSNNSWSQRACSLVVGVCCLSLGHSQQCLRGRQAALEGLLCSSTSEEIRECCSCCQLGSIAAESGLRCEIPERFNSGCRDSFVECCQNRPQTVLLATPKSVHRTEFTVTSITKGVTRNLCDEDTCDQLCRMKNDDEFECHCRVGFKLNPDGITCGDVNECVDTVLRHNCTSGERCVNFFGGFQCQPDPKLVTPSEERHCPSGLNWSSRYRRCEDINECSTGIHRCVPGTSCVNTPGSYNCIYQSSTSSTSRPFHATTRRSRRSSRRSTTERQTDSAFQVRTRSRPFWSHLQTAAPQATQRCGPGYRLKDDRHCEDIDECLADDACPLPNMICRNTPGSFVCTCSTGYQFNPRMKLCEDIDECRTRRHDCSASDEVCENSIGSYICRSVGGNCSRGYAADPITGRCTDVDECSQPRRRCSTGSVCVNTPGSFRCEAISCGKGTMLDAQGRCSDIDECRINARICSDPNQVCQNTPGSYVCRSTISCGIGYELNSQGNRCEDVNECETGRHSCNGTLMTCVNRPGTYICQCPDGYQINHATHSCDDIDECHKFGGHVCAQNSNCENTPGSFRCSCQQGFQLEPYSKYCSDINECLEPGVCQSSCRNTWGSYYCLCSDGYQLTRDGRTCTDIDECSLWLESGQSADVCHGLCHNIPGSYLCSCPTGYQMSSDGRACNDVDECSVGLANCRDPDEVCLNTGGSYDCRRIVCPRGFVKTPTVDDEQPEPSLGSANVVVHRGGAREDHLARQSNRDYLYAVPFQTSTASTIRTFKPYSSNVLRGVVAQPILFLSNEDSGVVCQKVECAANDISCVLNLTKSIQWQHFALPSIHFVSDPIVIVNVQTIAASVHPNNEFSIVAGNELGLFDVIKKPGFGDRGSVRLVKPIKGPAEYSLTLRMDNYNRYHNLISQHIAHIVINVSKYRF